MKVNSTKDATQAGTEIALCTQQVNTRCQALMMMHMNEQHYPSKIKEFRMARSSTDMKSEWSRLTWEQLAFDRLEEEIILGQLSSTR